MENNFDIKELNDDFTNAKAKGVDQIMLRLLVYIVLKKMTKQEIEEFFSSQTCSFDKAVENHDTINTFRKFLLEKKRVLDDSFKMKINVSR